MQRLSSGPFIRAFRPDRAPGRGQAVQAPGLSPGEAVHDKDLDRCMRLTGRPGSDHRSSTALPRNLRISAAFSSDA
jgi:hypothetical protein